MAPTATTEEIRRAYRTLARQHHPDTAGAGSGPRMAAVNQAWFVLSDPGRRAIYDATLRGRPARPVPSASAWPAHGPGDLDDTECFVPIRHPLARLGIPLPWLVVLVALGVIFVFTAYAVRPTSGGSGGTPDGVIEVGSCVTVAAVGAVVETSCNVPHEGRVVAIPARGLYCNDGAEAYADGDSRRVVCVRRG